MSITNQMTDILFKFSEDLVKPRNRCWKPLIDIGIEEGVKINNLLWLLPCSINML